MPTVTRNLIGNFVGRGIAAALSLLLVPVYIRYLGIEAYGLIAFYVVLQTLFGILDLGLTTTTNREIAMRVPDPARHAETRDLLRTVEWIYWAIGLAVGVTITAIAPLIAKHWLHPETLDVGTVQTAILLMGINVALQWPYTIYEGVLHGLQRIVEFNTIAAGMNILRGIGAVVVVSIRPTVTAFFLWQLAMSVVTLSLLAISAWRHMPAGPRPHARMHLLAGVWRFALGMTAAVALGVVLSHADRLILSRMLPLETFGYYSVAASVATGLMYLMSPISLTVLPRFTELLSTQRHDDLVRTYHLASQLMSVVQVPVAMTLCFFSREVMMLWTRDATIAARTSSLVSILVPAMLLFALMDIPYMLQLSHGKARLAVVTNVCAVAFYVPVLLVLVKRYGAIGAASALLVLYVAKFLVWTHVVHAQVLPDQKGRWYLDDVAKPALAAIAVLAVARLVIPRSFFDSLVPGVLLLGAIVAAAAAAAVLAGPLTRERALAHLPVLRQPRIDP